MRKCVSKTAGTNIDQDECKIVTLIMIKIPIVVITRIKKIAKIAANEKEVVEIRKGEVIKLQQS